MDSASPTAPDTPQYGQENGPEQPERAPFHGSQSPFSPSSSPEGAHPNGKPHGEPKEGSSPTSSVAKGDQTKERVHTIVSTVTCDPCSPVKSGRSVDGNSSVGLTARSTEEEVVKEPSSTGEARLVAERDVRCLIGVFSFMAGLLVPANLSWLLLLASFSASVNILSRLSPRLRLAAQEGRLMPVFCNPLGAVEGRQETNPTATAALSHESMTTSERSAKVPLLHSLSTLSTLSLQCNRHEAGVRSASPLLGAGPLGKNGSRRSLFAVMSQRLGESFKNMTVERSCDPLEGARDADGATIQGGDDERADEASRGLNCGADADSQGSSRGIEMRRGDLHWQVHNLCTDVSFLFCDCWVTFNDG